MNRRQYLLTKLAEEANEVAQISLKTQQFGFNEKMKDQPYTNVERNHKELNDLFAIVEMLNEEFGFGFNINRQEVEDKKIKVNKYYQYSVNLGEVAENN